MADEIFVINVGGYIGSSTRSEIDYATNTGKVVSYLEPIDIQPNGNEQIKMNFFKLCETLGNIITNASIKIEESLSRSNETISKLKDLDNYDFTNINLYSELKNENNEKKEKTDLITQ
jgi:hypothetical protein